MTRPNPRPGDDQQWVRSIEARLRKLESPTSLPVGQWTIVSQDGSLLAVKPGEDTTTVAGDEPEVVDISAQRGYVTTTELISDLAGDDNTLSGSQDLTQVLADVKSIIGNPAGLGTSFPNAGNVAGANIVDALGQLINGLVNGAVGLVGGSTSVAQVANSVTALRLSVDNATDVAQKVSAENALRAISHPGFHAVDPTLNASFNITTLNDTDPTTVPLTEDASRIAFITAQNNAVKASVAWLGYGNANIDELYVNVYKVDTTTGAMTPVSASPNVVSAVGFELDWVYVPIAAPITVAQGEVYAVEVQIVGSGTHTMVGLPDYWIPNHPTVFPQQLAAQRGAQPPQFDAVGDGYTGTAQSGQFSHTASPGATVIVAVSTFAAGYANNTRTVVWDPTGVNLPMQSLGVRSHNGEDFWGWTELFVVHDVRGGTKQIAFNNVIVAGVTTDLVNVQSVSYIGVGAVGAAVFATGAATPMASGAVASNGMQRVVQVFGVSSSGTPVSFTGYDGTSRRYVEAAAAGGKYVPMLLGDKVGSSATTFAAAESSNQRWASIAVPLFGVVGDPVPVASPVYSRQVPWLALSSQTQGTQGRHAPEYREFNAPITYVPPFWSTSLDWVGVGGGGSGQGELGFNMGQGGSPGEWNSTTLDAGVDFIAGATVFTITPGEGGPGIVGYFLNGNPGEDTTITWTDPFGVARSLTCAGGAGGVLSDLFHYQGDGPGDYTYLERQYYGGAATAPGANGNAPGGGGGGAVVFQPFSGAGGNGAAWATASAAAMLASHTTTTITGIGIPPNHAVGVGVIPPPVKAVNFVSVAGARALGTPALNTGPVSISGIGLAHTKALGTPTVVQAGDFVTLDSATGNLMYKGKRFKVAGSNIGNDIGFVATANGNAYGGVDNGGYYLTTHSQADAALNSAQGMNANTIRIFSAVANSHGAPTAITFQPTIGTFNPAALDPLDYALSQCALKGIKAIIPFVDEYNSKAWFVANTTGGAASDFYTNATTINAFTTYISAVLDHLNPYTGIRLRDDPTIIAWETGNELTGSGASSAQFASWTDTVSRHIKLTKGAQQLVLDGGYGTTGDWNTYEDLRYALPYVHIYSNHSYDNWRTPANMVLEGTHAHSFGKAFIVGEFTWKGSGVAPQPTWTLGQMLKTFEASQYVDGGLLWQLFAPLTIWGDGYTLHFPPDATYNGVSLAEAQYRSVELSDHAFRMAGVTPRIFVNEDFSGTNGAELSTRAGPLGAAWAKQNGWTGDVLIQNGRAWGGATQARYYASGVSAARDYEVTANVTIVSNPSGAYAGILLRADTAVNAGYVIYVWNNAGSISIGCDNEAAGASMGAVGGLPALTVGNTYPLRVTVEGTPTTFESVLQIYWQGNKVLGPIIDGNMPQAGRVGILSLGNGAATGYHTDSLVATDAIPNVVMAPAPSLVLPNQRLARLNYGALQRL